MPSDARTSGGRLDMAGVIVFGVRDDRIARRVCPSSPSSARAPASNAAVCDMTAER
jgi:hypothetical protein